MAELRAFVYLDRLQPQFGSFLGANARGYLPVPGMAAAVVEVAPGIIVSQALDAALKATQVRPGLMVVERHFGLLEFHSPAQAEVKHAAGVVLGSMGFALEDRRRPLVLSSQVIRKVDPYHAQMVNLERAGSLLLPGQDIYILECQPAAYVALAATSREERPGDPGGLQPGGRWAVILAGARPTWTGRPRRRDGPGRGVGGSRRERGDEVGAGGERPVESLFAVMAGPATAPVKVPSTPEWTWAPPTW